MKTKQIALTIALLLATAGSLSAQRPFRGVALGADRDSLQYIIASPFDNWWLNAGVGLQTFIGNERDWSARRNTLDYNARVEVGKWVIPDVAVSLRLTAFSAHGQSRYGLQPFIDFTNVPLDADGNYEYQPFAAHALAAIGLVTFDWTNFLHGYQAGSHRHWHVLTPIGLGMSMLYGRQVNPYDNHGFHIGDFRRNFELCYTLGVTLEYYFTNHFSMNLTAELGGSESTWDWSPYVSTNQNLEFNIFDLYPSITLGARIGLFKTVVKYNPRTKTTQREKVYHEFLAYGARNTVEMLRDSVERISERYDSVAGLAGHFDSTLNDMRRLRDSLEDRLDSIRQAQPERKPTNMLAELINANEELNLPATVVYFKLDKWDLDYNARKKLQNFARELNALPDTLEYYCIGAADSITATIPHNQWLSEHRSQVARDMLVNQLGVSANQLIMVPVGGIMDFYPQENNRMTLIIQRTPETEEIVNRWIARRNRRR